ncbi:MAG TPA: hypothetical protein VM491_07500, partial [Burkholderiaceae bacterium]|nr:hypothetical protein [Burkholderiaceae bacterium]
MTRADPQAEPVLETCAAGLAAAERLLESLQRELRLLLAAPAADPADPADPLTREQHRAHGCAWTATYVQALREMLDWSRRLAAAGQLGELETLLLRAAYAEYLAQLAGGVPMSQGEIFRPESMPGAAEALSRYAADPAVAALRRDGFSPAVRRRIAARLADGRTARQFGDPAY